MEVRCPAMSESTVYQLTEKTLKSELESVVKSGESSLGDKYEGHREAELRDGDLCSLLCFLLPSGHTRAAHLDQRLTSAVSPAGRCSFKPRTSCLLLNQVHLEKDATACGK